MFCTSILTDFRQYFIFICTSLKDFLSWSFFIDQDVSNYQKGNRIKIVSVRLSRMVTISEKMSNNSVGGLFFKRRIFKEMWAFQIRIVNNKSHFAIARKFRGDEVTDIPNIQRAPKFCHLLNINWVVPTSFVIQWLR